MRRSLGIGLLGATALLCSSCAGGPHHLAAKVTDRAAAVRVRTDPVTSTTSSVPSTTTTTSPVKTNPSTFAPPPVAVPTTTTTTTAPLPPACVWSNFATKVTTDQSSYGPGQPVDISLSFSNNGPACSVNQTGYACPLVNISDSSGALVWTSSAPTSTGCPSTFAPTVLAANWSQGFSFAWGQASCTPGQAACPGRQEPPGSYQVTGLSSGGSGQIPASAPVVISLTS